MGQQRRLNSNRGSCRRLLSVRVGECAERCFAVPIRRQIYWTARVWIKVGRPRLEGSIDSPVLTQGKLQKTLGVFYLQWISSSLSLSLSYWFGLVPTVVVVAVVLFFAYSYLVRRNELGSFIGQRI
jgi:hypothetical protein